MNIHRLTGIAIGGIIGICLVSIASTPTTVCKLLLALLCVLGLIFSIIAWRSEQKWSPWPKCLIFLFAMMFALPIGYTRTIQFNQSRASTDLRIALDTITPGETLTLTGKVASEPEWRDNNRVDIELNVLSIAAMHDAGAVLIPIASGKVLVQASAYRSTKTEKIQHLHTVASPFTYGDLIEVKAKYQPSVPALNPNEFDYGQYLKSIGIEASFRCSASNIQMMEKQLGHPVTALALWTKSHFINTFKKSIRSPASRLASAATLGTRRSLEGMSYRGMDIITMFRHAGVGHVLAVSGLHVSVITVLLFMIFRATGCPTRVFTPPLILFLILFAILTGARPSSVRAVIMNSAALIMIAYFRCNIKTATYIGLSLSASAILLHNPSLIFAPSFLLSYGAVLSLLLLVGPIQRFLLSLRGVALVFFLVWFGTMIATAGWHYSALTSPAKLISLFVLLVVLIRAGNSLNNAVPSMWSKGFVSLPPWICLFFSAQLSIQIGMMLPLSAWFFGKFPVAGVFVNLAAIPIVGILVQLGMLVGLVGLIPWIGPLAALPLGAATTLVGETFLFIAHLGATVFPFPVTPKPSVTQLTVYYAILSIALCMYHQRNRILHWVYLYQFKRAHKRVWNPIITGISVSVLAVIPWLYRAPTPTAKSVHVLATRNYPVLLIHGNNTVDVINMGDQYTSERIVLDQLQVLGTTKIRDAYVPSPSPDAGIEGAAALARQIPFDSILLPILPTEDQTFTDAIGDAYVKEAVREGKYWAARYDIAYERLQETREDNPSLQLRTISSHVVETPGWQNVTIKHLPLFSEVADRFQSSAITPIMHFTLNDCSWVVITDTTREALKEALHEPVPCNILVVSDQHTRQSYIQWLEIAVERLAPDVVIISGNTPIDWPEPFQDWLNKKQDHGLYWIETARDGAVTATYRHDNKATLRTFISPINIQFSYK